MSETLASPLCNPIASTHSVLFSDVVSSTDMIDRDGELAWLATLERHARLLNSLAGHNSGSVSNFLGDGFMVLFDHAADAVACALRIQEASSVQGLLGIRIGVDHGDIYPYHEGWWVGRTIHHAARLTDLCDAGDVVLSQRCFDSARERIALPAGTEQVVHLRGFCEPSVVHIVRPDRLL
jgi:class 3 adenylate cyclase